MTRQSEATHGRGSTDYRREAGSSKRLRRAIKKGDKQRAPKQQKLALWHYSSPDHRSVRRASRGPIHGQVNGTRKRACMHPRTTRTMEQVSDCPSEFDLVSRVDPDLERGPPLLNGI
ncbi:hypothetical protein CDL15_Pgr014145 [Punica granatum]|uniref:Uncharacterized protein n=1 Tax=Punica granatum TaxID=22663 RepID=A0A218XZ23_PUNGR|nr:hypothetical protein CDL15_Pgr014145 [Punica granatum]